MNYKITGYIPGGEGLFTTDVQYRVTKQYPAGPKPGTVLTLVGTDVHSEPTHYRYSGDFEGTGSYIERELVENDSEFFEKYNNG